MYGDGWTYGMPAVLYCAVLHCTSIGSCSFAGIECIAGPEAANISPLYPSTPSLVSRGYCSGFTQTTQTQTQQEAIPNTGYACVG